MYQERCISPFTVIAPFVEPLEFAILLGPNQSAFAVAER
jgi:hypothetical protein